ncbi:MAG: RICIN domain-containing protein [Ignavibacteriales bacterium]|nr:RICIN domain-containing protein [Ignavibacteriales bacterium]MCF8305821.1 RICIN domain-containing protein [Ignavibacteriales bacterium]MCF8315543.1 RICIN domain-containing protein [Ignavibacteriales bacterium]MCF8436927.1 RICIN domain-containing protein [Ignavibacteriales bacterium]
MLKKTSLFIVTSLILLFTVRLSAQSWKTEINGYHFFIKVADSDKYLDLPGKHPKTADKNIQFQIWDKTDDEFERTFVFPTINGTEYYAIKNKAGFILDIGGKDELNVKEKLQKKTGKKFKMKKDNGAEIQTWEMSPKGVSKWQQWKLIIVDKNKVMFENVFTDKMMNVEGSINNNGSKLTSSKRNNGANQMFVLEYADGPKKGQLLEFN